MIVRHFYFNSFPHGEVMRKIYLTGIGIFILFFSPARLMAQKDTFENRWEGEKREGAAYGAES